MAEFEEMPKRIPDLIRMIDGEVPKAETADAIPDPLTADELEFLPDIDTLDRDELEVLLGRLEDLMDSLEDEEPDEDTEAHDEWEESMDEVTELAEEVESRIEEMEEDE